MNARTDSHTVNFVYNDTRRGIRKVSFFAKWRYIRSLVILQLDGTLLWVWEFCRYSRIVVISAVVISEVDCTRVQKHVYGCPHAQENTNLHAHTHTHKLSLYPSLSIYLSLSISLSLSHSLYLSIYLSISLRGVGR